MSRYLLTVRSSGALDAIRALPPPADYLVECLEGEPPSDDTVPDGLEHWQIELQIAGTVGDWAKGGAYDVFWSHLDSALGGLDVKPHGYLTMKSKVDPNRVAVSFGYLAPHVVTRARTELRQRIAAVVDPKTKRLGSDIELAFH